MIRQAKRIGVTVLLGALSCSLALGQAPSLTRTSWTPINAGLSNSFLGIAVLTVDPSTSSTLYAITPKGGLFKTTDAAASWQVVGGLASPSFVAIDPKTTSTVYAATQQGIVKSTDGGERWNPANGNLTDSCYMLAVDPVTPTTMYGLSYGKIFKTTNGGESWTQIHAPPSDAPSVYSNGSLAIDPTAPSTIYASANNGEIIKSTDGGEDWMTIKPGIPLSIFSTSALPLVIDPGNPSILYAGSFAAAATSTTRGVPPLDFGQGSISKSTDGGQTWITVRTGIPGSASVVSLAVDQASPSTVYAGYRGGVLKSTDQGQSWTVINTINAINGDGFQSAIVVVDPRTPSTIYAAYLTLSGTGTLSKSTDAGSSWQPSNEGLAYYDLHTLAIDPVSPTTVYTGGVDGVFKSDNAGGNWTNLAAFHVSSRYPPGVGVADVRSLLVDFKSPNILYVETLRVNGCAIDDNTVFKSWNGGATWSDSISPPGSGCILGYLAYTTLMAMDPEDPNTLYLGETDDEDGFYALLKSTDGGADWTSIWNAGNGLQSGLNALAIDSVTPTTLYAGLFTGVFKSTDGGATWNVTALKDTFVTALAIHRTKPSVLYAVASGGLFKSVDAGASWVATGVAGVNATSVVIAPNDSDIVYAATPGGIYKSLDGGANWTAFSDGLTNLNIRALAIVPGTPTTLYAATPAGVFRAVDAVVTKVPAVTDAPWADAIAAMKTAAETDSLNFWQWAWYWQYLPSFNGAPAGFGVAESISPDLMEQIIIAGGGDPLLKISAAQWVSCFLQVVPQ